LFGDDTGSISIVGIRVIPIKPDFMWRAVVKCGILIGVDLAWISQTRLLISVVNIEVEFWRILSRGFFRLAIFVTLWVVESALNTFFNFRYPWSGPNLGNFLRLAGDFRARKYRPCLYIRVPSRRKNMIFPSR
jgi:hypothetical protein